MNQRQADLTVEQAERRNDAVEDNPVKKPYVEPAVSVPNDVLEATRFFQQPTIEASTV